MSIITPEQKETEPTPQGLYVVFEGPGSTGKTSFQHAVRFLLGDFITDFRERFNTTNITEPPDFSRFEELPGVMSPSKVVKTGAITFPVAIFLHVVANRDLAWNGAEVDGTPLDVPWINLIEPPNGIVLASRSPLSSVYQGLYPGGDFPIDSKIAWGTYNIFQIPFPDVMYVLMPDPVKQKARLAARIRADDGRTDDVFDDPQKQDPIFEGYCAYLELLSSWPGIYRINSQEVVSQPGINLSTVLAFHILCMLAEKGAIDTYIPIYSWGSVIRSAPIHLTRINTPPFLSAYIFLNAIPNLVDFDRVRYSAIKDKLHIEFGDIGIIPFGENMILVAIEDRTQINWSEASILIHDLLQRGEYCEVNQASRYGLIPFQRRDIQRAWSNISW